MARRTQTRKTTITVDFKGVEGRINLADGDYEAAVKEITQEEGDKADYFKWVFEVTQKEGKGAQLYYNTSLASQSLWNLRNLLEALGVEVPDGPLEIDFADLVDLPIGLTVAKEEFEGKNRTRVIDFYAIDGEPEKEPEPEKPSGRRSRRAEKEPEEEKPAGRRSRRGKEPEPEKVKADDVTEMDEDQLAELVEEHDLGIDLDEHKTLRKKANAVLDALEDKGLLEE